MNFNYDVLDSTEKIIFALRSLYMEYGYTQYRMGKFEEYDLYSKNKDFLVSDSVITFTDTNGKLMALKPDVTLSIIKNNKDNPDSIQKLCYNENVYRVSKGTNTFKEIMQTGLECIGNINEKCVGEVLLLAAKSLETVSNDFVLEVSNLSILSSFIESVSESYSVKQSLIKCVGEKNMHGILKICKENGISEENAQSLKKLVSTYGAPEKVLPELKEICSGKNIDEEITLLENTLKVFSDTDLYKKIQIDFSAVGDMNYYNGIIFKGFVAGIPESVLSGGQYDKLMKKMGKKSKAAGFAVYIDLLERIGGADIG